MKKINKIVVHNGPFHADDVMCVAIMKRVNPAIEVLRTRTITDEMINSEHVIIADVGLGKYDHHQDDAELREDGNKFAACGLLFREFASKIFPDTQSIDEFRVKFIIPIEDADNGSTPNPLSAMVSQMNPNWDSCTSFDDAFARAVLFMDALLDDFIETTNSRIRATSIVKEAVTNSINKVVILDRFVPWQKIVCDESDAEFIVFPDSNSGEYRVQCVPVTAGSFKFRKPLPFDKTAEGCTFIHPAGFISGFKTKDDALRALSI